MKDDRVRPLRTYLHINQCHATKVATTRVPEFFNIGKIQLETTGLGEAFQCAFLVGGSIR